MRIKEGKRQVADNLSIEGRRPCRVVAPPVQQQKDQQGGQRAWTSKPKRLFTPLHMPISQALQHLLKMNLVTLREPHPAPDTSSPNFNHNARCAFHSNSPGHDTDDCWALRHQIQDLIDAKEIEFDPPETPDVITTPTPKH